MGLENIQNTTMLGTSNSKKNSSGKDSSGKDISGKDISAKIQDMLPLLQEMASEFVNNWPANKYNPDYTIGFFSLYWHDQKKIVESDASSFGRYNEVVLSLVDFLKSSAPEKYESPRIKLPEEFQLRRLVLEVKSNEYVIRDAFIGLVATPDLQKQVMRIATGQELVNDAGYAFVDFYGQFKGADKYNLSDFLSLFDLNAAVFCKRGGNKYGAYRFLLDSLEKEHGSQWKSRFIGMIDDASLAERINGIEENYGRSHFDENAVQFVEKLEKNGVVGLVEFLEEDSYEYLKCMFGEEKFPESDRTMIEELISRKRKEFENAQNSHQPNDSKKGIRYYLGMCRKKVSPDYAAYDWSRKFIDETCRRMNRKLLESNLLVTRLLETRAREEYSHFFREDADKAFVLLESEIKDAEAENPAKAHILQRTYDHFDLMYRKLRETPGVRNRIPVVRKRDQ